MKKEQLYTLFGGIDDELVEQAEAYKPPARRKWAVRLLPAAACLALAAGTALFLPRLLEPAAPPFQGATYSSLEDIPRAAPICIYPLPPAGWGMTKSRRR